MFAGLGVLLVITPVNVFLVRWCRKYSKLGMEEKDKRMKLMNEILNGIKVHSNLFFSAEDINFQLKCCIITSIPIKPRREKTCLRGLRP